MLMKYFQNVIRWLVLIKIFQSVIVFAQQQNANLEFPKESKIANFIYRLLNFIYNQNSDGSLSDGIMTGFQKKKIGLL